MTGAEAVNTNSPRDQIFRKLRDRDYRDSFVAELIYSHIPLKIRALREQRGMTQKQLGERAGMAQTWVSKLEDPNYGKLTISTLLKLASAFDVGLVVDFVPFSRLLDSAVTLSPNSFEVPSFTEEQEAEAGLESVESIAAASPTGDLNTTFLDQVMAARQPRHSPAEQMQKSLKGQGQTPPYIMQVLAGVQKTGGSTYAALGGYPR